jgi:16S rRNA (cytosine1402-N4)-methyltransferase
MVRDILENFAIFRDRKDLRYFDGTFGRGGHLRAVLLNFPQIKAVVMDQDDTAVKFGAENFKTEVESEQVRIIHGNFAEFQEHNLGSFDMMLLDLGVSSPQLDTADRGFSFNKEGPLDMRMNQTQGITAEYILNTASEQELNEMFKEYGEIHRPFRVVRAIVHDRKTKAWQSTKELASLIERIDGWRHKGFHPATQYFMALRLRVNSEIQVLEHALPTMMKSLRPGGRLAVISFHSLEDRIVKNIFKSHKDLGGQTHKRVLLPTQEECEINSRSRSAKLRVFERRVQDELKEF